jgi:uncharacterized protein with HEPN domain
VPPRPWRLRVEDILENIELIQEFTRELSFEEFIKDRKLILAVERCFEIIGEAARHVPDDLQTRHPQIPWRKLREMRNLISHVYFKVSRTIMWDTIEEVLPPLVPKLRELLEKET